MDFTYENLMTLNGYIGLAEHTFDKNKYVSGTYGYYFFEKKYFESTNLLFPSLLQNRFEASPEGVDVPCHSGLWDLSELFTDEPHEGLTVGWPSLTDASLHLRPDVLNYV